MEVAIFYVSAGLARHRGKGLRRRGRGSEFMIKKRRTGASPTTVGSEPSHILVREDGAWRLAGMRLSPIATPTTVLQQEMIKMSESLVKWVYFVSIMLTSWWRA